MTNKELRQKIRTGSFATTFLLYTGLSLIILFYLNYLPHHADIQILSILVFVSIGILLYWVWIAKTSDVPVNLSLYQGPSNRDLPMFILAVYFFLINITTYSIVIGLIIITIEICDRLEEELKMTIEYNQSRKKALNAEELNDLSDEEIELLFNQNT